MVGRKRKDKPTVHGQRLRWLIIQFEEKGTSVPEFAVLTGLGQSYCYAVRDNENAGPKGISAEIIQAVKDGVGLDPRYFFDPYEGPRDHKFYLLDTKREQARLAELQTEVQELRAWKREQERRDAERDERERQMQDRIALLEEQRRRQNGGPPTPPPAPPPDELKSRRQQRDATKQSTTKKRRPKL